jgi:2-methylcitrate dehydratase PrpD
VLGGYLMRKYKYEGDALILGYVLGPMIERSLRQGNAGIGDFTPDAIKDPRVLEIAQKVNPIILPELTRREVDPSIVEIKIKDGNRYSRRMDNRIGTPENPMSPEEFADKFRDCLAHGRKHISQQKTENIMKLLNDLEEIDDVGKVIRILGQRDKGEVRSFKT